MTLEQKIVVAFWLSVLLVVAGVVVTGLTNVGALYGVRAGVLMTQALIPTGLIGAVVFSLWAFFR